MDSAVWIDGRMVGPDEAVLPVADHAIIVGDGAFETLLIVDDPHRTAFAISRHLDRLHRSCRVLGIDVAQPDDRIRDAITSCVAAAPDAGVVRITVSSGVGPLASSRGDNAGSVIVIAGGRPPSYTPATAVAVFPHPRNERGALAGVKTSSYAENVLALRYAQQRGATEAIFANTRGELCEGTGTNVFWVADDRIHTPPLSAGGLAGVTRELLMEQVDVVEANLPIESLTDVSEAFLTSSTRAVQSIGKVDGAGLAVIDGPATKSAAEALADLMAGNVDP
jgi:branched-chain amino acid aminotransferase